MAKHSFKFDPGAGVAQGVNLVVNTGANFRDEFTITDVNGSAFSFTKSDNTPWAISAQMAKGVAITNAPVIGFGTVGTVVQVGSANTASTQIHPGTAVTFTRPGTASTIYDVAQGTLLVVAGISSSP